MVGVEERIGQLANIKITSSHERVAKSKSNDVFSSELTFRGAPIGPIKETDRLDVPQAAMTNRATQRFRQEQHTLTTGWNIIHSHIMIDSPKQLQCDQTLYKLMSTFFESWPRALARFLNFWIDLLPRIPPPHDLLISSALSR